MQVGKLVFFLAVAFCGAPLATSATPATNMVFILDASNSMNAPTGAETKLAVAKAVLGDLITELPSDIRVGVMVYGHRKGKDEKDACFDVGVLGHVGSVARDELVNRVRAVQAKGQTPIANSLMLSQAAFAELRDQNNHVVLISDGIETCGGDPCEAARALAEEGITAKVHVVGFAVGEEEQKDLECIARLGQGRFFQAADAGELRTAFQGAREAATRAEPAATVIWREQFGSDDLAEQWRVLDPDPDGYVVEDGNLLIVASQPATLLTEKFPNLMLAETEMPAGDWRLTARLRLDPQTGWDRLYAGVRDGDDGDAVAAVIDVYGGAPGGSPGWLKLLTLKASGGRETVTERQLAHVHHANRRHLSKFIAETPVTLHLEKLGRRYVASIEFPVTDQQREQYKKLGVNLAEGVTFEQGQTTKTDELTMLRAPEHVFIGMAPGDERQGESLVYVDEIVVESLEE